MALAKIPDGGKHSTKREAINQNFTKGNVTFGEKLTGWTWKMERAQSKIRTFQILSLVQPYVYAVLHLSGQKAVPK